MKRFKVDDIPLPPSKSEDSKLDKYKKSSSQMRKRNVKLPLGLIKKDENVNIRYERDGYRRKELFLPTFSDRLQLAMACMNEVDSRNFERMLNGNSTEKRSSEHQKPTLNQPSQTQTKPSRHEERVRHKPELRWAERRERSRSRGTRRDHRRPHYEPHYKHSGHVYHETSGYHNHQQQQQHRHSGGRHYHPYLRSGRQQSGGMNHGTHYDELRRDRGPRRDHGRNISPIHRRGSPRRPVLNVVHVPASHRYRRYHFSPPSKSHAPSQPVPHPPRVKQPPQPDNCSSSASSLSSSPTSSSSTTSSITAASKTSHNSSTTSSRTSPLSSTSVPSSPTRPPLVSPKSPDVVKDVTLVATNYLRQLESTLLKMNNAYKNACPPKRPQPDPMLSQEHLQQHQPPPPPPPPPPPLQQHHQPRVPASQVPLPPGKPRSHRTRSNSLLDADILELADPLLLQAYSRSSDSSITSSQQLSCSDRPPVATALTGNHDRAVLGGSMLASGALWGAGPLVCDCGVPNPDEWERGQRACGRGGLQLCQLAELRLQCASLEAGLCPAGSLCHNRDFSQSTSAALFHDGEQWRPLATRSLASAELATEVGGNLRSTTSLPYCRTTVLLTPSLGLDTAGDSSCVLHYMRSLVPTATADTPNVELQKWIVDSSVRLGLFATRQIERGEELRLGTAPSDSKDNSDRPRQLYASIRTGPVVGAVPTTADGAAGTGDEEDKAATDVHDMLRLVVHEELSPVIMVQWLVPALRARVTGSQASVRFLRLGGPLLLLLYCCQLLLDLDDDDDKLSHRQQHPHSYTGKPTPADALILLDKVLQLLLEVSPSHCPPDHVFSLGVDSRDTLSVLRVRVKILRPASASDPLYLVTHTLLDRIDKLAVVLDHVASSTDKDRGLRPEPGSSDMEESLLQCRLPPYWVSQVHHHHPHHNHRDQQQPHQESASGQRRVFFYNKVTGVVQWEMPVFPWESGHEEHHELYDYNQASNFPVTHDEVQQMYVNLNRQYELKQKKMIVKTKDRIEKKSDDDKKKRHAFKNEIATVIREVLRPYRESSCSTGRITTAQDMTYLSNKLSETVLAKELRILQESCESLRVTAVVRAKVRTYVQTYMRSRGPVYERHRVTAETL